MVKVSCICHKLSAIKIRVHTGAFGGRLDHTLSNINTLYTHQHLRLVLCGEGSLAR